MDILEIFDKINEFTGKLSEIDFSVDSMTESCGNFGIPNNYGIGLYATEKGIIKRSKIKDRKEDGIQYYLIVDKKLTPVVLYPTKKIFVSNKIEMELSDLKNTKRMMDDECLTSLSKFKVFLQLFGKEDGWFDGNSDDVVLYHKLIARLSNELQLKMEKLNNKFGWNENKFSPYDCLVYLDDQVLKSLETAFCPIGNRNDWIEEVEKYRENNNFEAMFLTSLASPLLKPFNLIPWWLHASGKASTGKTAAMIVCESIYGDPKKIEVAFNITIPGLENRCNVLNNLPVFLNDSQMLNKHISPDQLVYMSFEGKGRSRANATELNRKVKTWCNNTISSGEKALLNTNAFEGATKRCIQLDGKWMDIKYSKKVRQIFYDNYGNVGREWIEVIKKQSKENIYKLSDYIYEKIKNDNNIDDNIIQVTVMCISKYLYDVNLIKIEKEIALQKTIEFGIKLLKIIGNDVTTESYDMCNKIVNYLKGFVVQNLSRFEDDLGQYERFGFIKNGNVCFLNNKLNEILVKEFNYDPKLFRKEIRERNLIVLDNNNQIKLIKYNKVSDRYPQFLASLFFGEVEENIEAEIRQDIVTVKVLDRKSKNSLIKSTIRLDINTEPNFYFDLNDTLIIPEFTNESTVMGIKNKYMLNNLEVGMNLIEVFKIKNERGLK